MSRSAKHYATVALSSVGAVLVTRFVGFWVLGLIAVLLISAVAYMYIHVQLAG